MKSPKLDGLGSVGCRVFHKQFHVRRSCIWPAISKIRSERWAYKCILINYEVMNCPMKLYKFGSWKLETGSCSKCNIHNHHQKSEIAKHGLCRICRESTGREVLGPKWFFFFRSQEGTRRSPGYQIVQGIRSILFLSAGYCSQYRYNGWWQVRNIYGIQIKVLVHSCLSHMNSWHGTRMLYTIKEPLYLQQ